MKTTKMANFLRGIILIGVAFAFLSSFDWFRTLLRNLFIGIICVAGVILIYFGVEYYRRFRER